VTGGLPRVEEIFEARRPKQRELAIITKLDGWVRLPKQEEVTEEMEKKLERKRRRGTRLILITNKEGEILTGYEVEVGKHVIVSDGDWVSTGTKLVDGSIDPHEYLEVMGEKATQEYLLNEVQEVYRLQGVRINDKHIEVIIRQMMRKVTITDPGDTNYLPDDDVDRVSVLRDNAEVVAKGGKPAQFKPRLLGITKASLGTESFISAASFQETTRVLTQAAISGRSDYLMGLKENVIMGHLIPAGTGWEFNKRRRGSLHR
jgi:DNA-directed RNA polymerase subunit beta'